MFLNNAFLSRFLDIYGRTALDHAAYHGHFKALEQLIEIGAQAE
jgi:ankyrin repeat protein